MTQVDALKDWFNALQQRERMLVITTVVIVSITLFYLIVWEPIHKAQEDQQKLHYTQLNNLIWMQQAAMEVKSLKSKGLNIQRINSNQPVSLSIEQSISTAGLKNNLDILESSGKGGAKIKLQAASFDQMLIWLNTLKQRYGISVISASVERTDKPGIINARLSFEKTNG